MGKKNVVGPMRHQIKIQTEAQTDDGGGGYVLGWTTTATVWANIKPISGREHLLTAQLADIITHRITIRARSDLTFTGKNRILFGTRAFNVKHVINVGERDRYLELQAEEGVAT